MNRTLSVSKSGLNAHQRKMDAIANNIANAQTTGYKKTSVEFKELLRDMLGTTGTPVSDELMERNPSQGTGVKGDQVFRVFDQGILVQSDKPLDLAIEGEGFFNVYDENNNFLLTRVGNFSVSKAGMLVDHNGYKLNVDDAKNLNDYDMTTLSIKDDGQMTAIDKKGRLKEVGQIVLYDVQDKGKFEDVGNGYLKGEDLSLVKNSIKDSGFGSVRQGYNEMSNVDLSEEMIQLIITQRAYQMNIKSLQTADEMMSMVNGIRG